MDDLNRNTDVDTTRGTLGADANRTARVAADTRDVDNGAGDEIGEAVGGISGVLTGAALGSLGGPVGTVIGGIAGAVSGWWAGRAISEAAGQVTGEDEDYYRTHYEGSDRRLADRSYDDVRPAYQVGHIAARNPDYRDRGFEDVEPDLRHGWSADVSQTHGNWDDVRDYARTAYDRSRTSAFGMGAVAGSSTSSGADDTGERLADRAENTWDRTKDAARDAGHRAANAIDDMKDRVDGDPASRPGTDPTDRRF